MTGKRASKAVVSGKEATLGGRIRAARKAWGWTQEQVAQALGNDREIVSNWERDKIRPTRPYRKLLAELLGVTVEALETGEGFSIQEAPDRRKRPPAGRRGLARQLPAAEPGETLLVELESGSARPVTTAEAARALKVARAAARRVWILVSEA